MVRLERQRANDRRRSPASSIWLAAAVRYGARCSPGRSTSWRISGDWPFAVFALVVFAGMRLADERPAGSYTNHAAGSDPAGAAARRIDR